MTNHRKQGDSASIRRQAELLTIARHPGVVELIGLEGSADRPVLVTRRVVGPTLATPEVRAAEEVAGLARALASTLADLHDLGIVHGSVAAEHVLVAEDGRPVLCGFGAAGRIGEAVPGGDDELHPADDVAALGRLLRRLATGPDARMLRRIAEAATVADPGSRPSARELAAQIASAMPGARLPDRTSASAAGSLPGADLRSLVAGARADRARITVPRRGPAPPSAATGSDAAADRPHAELPVRPSPGAAPRRRSRIRAGALVGGVAAVAAGGLLVLTPWSSPAETAAPRLGLPSAWTIPPAVSTSTSAPPPPVSSSIPAPRSDCPVPASVLVADVDHDGCLDPVRYADGVLEGGGQRWSLGQDGDQVATGDWSCRGARTVALLRPATGEVFRFDAWATGAAESVTAPVIGVVPGGQAVRAADVDRDGCHELVVERGDMPPQVIRLPRAQP